MMSLDDFTVICSWTIQGGKYIRRSTLELQGLLSGYLALNG